MEKLSDEELSKITGKEAITLTSMMAFLSIGLITVVCYKFFKTGSGKATLPGGFTFTWK